MKRELSPKCLVDSYGTRSFSFALLKLWNSIPEDRFKTKLKTYFFKNVFYLMN